MEEVKYDNGFKWDPEDNSKFDTGERVSNYNNNTRKIFKVPENSRIIYVDGGAKVVFKGTGKQMSIGSWSFYDVVTDQLTGEYCENATNNQMELMAAIKALEYLNTCGYPKESWVSIKLDSEYVRLGIIFWVKKWYANNWKRVSRDGKVEEIKNLDLWKRLYNLSSERRIHWEHVKGHSGNEGNEKVDINCTLLIDEYVNINSK